MFLLSRSSSPTQPRAADKNTIHTIHTLKYWLCARMLHIYSLWVISLDTIKRMAVVSSLESRRAKDKRFKSAFYDKWCAASTTASHIGVFRLTLVTAVPSLPSFLSNSITPNATATNLITCRAFVFETPSIRHGLQLTTYPVFDSARL